MCLLFSNKYSCCNTVVHTRVAINVYLLINIFMRHLVSQLIVCILHSLGFGLYLGSTVVDGALE